CTIATLVIRIQTMLARNGTNPNEPCVESAPVLNSGDVAPATLRTAATMPHNPSHRGMNDRLSASTDTTPTATANGTPRNANTIAMPSNNTRTTASFGPGAATL